MGCIRRAISCLELTLVRLESYWYLMHLLAWYYFAFWLWQRANAVSEGCFAKFHKIIRKTVVMEYFFIKVADLKPETL